MSSSSWLRQCRAVKKVGRRPSSSRSSRLAAATNNTASAAPLRLLSLRRSWGRSITTTAIPQQQQQQFTTHSSSLSLASISTTTNGYQDYFDPNSAGYYQSWKNFAAAGAISLLAAAGLARRSVAQCEEAKAEVKTQQQPSDKDEQNNNNDTKDPYEIGPDDPYYNVPEEDEPTDCQMCLTFRQGPCRTEWKRFELCAKDKNPALKGNDNGDDNATTSEKEENDALACMKYAMPFYECSSKYVNTYILLGNEMTFQKVIHPLHEAFLEEEAQARRMCWAKSPEINWSGWDYFIGKLEELGGGVPTKFRLETTGFHSPVEALKASWKSDTDGGGGRQYLMMDNDNEPYLIGISAQIPKKQDDMTLMLTYALDQYGNLLGDKRYDGEEEEEAKALAEKEQQKGDQQPKEESPPSPNVEMHIQLLPGVTESVTLYGLYVPSHKDADFLKEGKLYESRPYSVPQSSSTTTTTTATTANDDDDSKVEKPKKQTTKKKKKKKSKTATTEENVAE